MAKITYIETDGVVHKVEVAAGKSVMQGAVDNALGGIAAECGGSMACATCHVYVDETWTDKLPQANDMESAMLDCISVERKPNSRLSCQISITDEHDGIVIHMPESQF